MLSERQLQAQAIATELHRLGAWVTNPMPLRSNDTLTFQVRDIDRDQVVAKLRSWDWNPAPCGTLPRVTTNGLEQASLFQIDLQPERAPIPDDRQAIQGERASREKTTLEIMALRKYLGIGPK